MNNKKQPRIKNDIKSDQSNKIDLSFEDAMKKALNTPLPKKSTGKKKKST